MAALSEAEEHVPVLLSEMITGLAPVPGVAGSHGWVGVGHPGGIGALTALGDQGVFGAVHDVNVLPQPKDLFQGNVPRLLAVRRLVEGLEAKGAVEAALARCRGWATLYGNNVLVATPAPGDGLPAGVLEYDTREDDDHGVDLRGPDLDASGQPLPFVACSNGHRVRGTDSCRRYDALLRGRAEAKAGPLSVEDLYAIGSLAALPDAGRSVSAAGIGTLHQVVALTGEGAFWVRFAPVEGNVRDAKPARFDVHALLEAVPVP